MVSFFSNKLEIQTEKLEPFFPESELFSQEFAQKYEILEKLGQVLIY